VAKVSLKHSSSFDKLLGRFTHDHERVLQTVVCEAFYVFCIFLQAEIGIVCND